MYHPLGHHQQELGDVGEAVLLALLISVCLGNAEQSRLVALEGESVDTFYWEMMRPIP